MTPEQIKEFRVSRKWSQQELAAKCGVAQTTICRIERGSPITRPVRLLLEQIMRDARSPEQGRVA